MGKPTLEALTTRGSPSDTNTLVNLNLLRKFLGAVPFQYAITSAYRSPSYNQSIGGSSTSQHPNGLAVDIVPNAMTNRELATWFWIHQHSYPELDQLIWYSSSRHLHIGICPPGGAGCLGGAPRKEFYSASSEGLGYNRWAPSQAEIAAVQAKFPQGRPLPWGWILGGLSLAIALGTGGYIWYRRRQ